MENETRIRKSCELEAEALLSIVESLFFAQNSDDIIDDIRGHYIDNISLYSESQSEKGINPSREMKSKRVLIAFDAHPISAELLESMALAEHAYNLELSKLAAIEVEEGGPNCVATNKRNYADSDGKFDQPLIPAIDHSPSKKSRGNFDSSEVCNLSKYIVEADRNTAAVDLPSSSITGVGDTIESMMDNKIADANPVDIMKEESTSDPPNYQSTTVVNIDLLSFTDSIKPPLQHLVPTDASLPPSTLTPAMSKPATNELKSATMTDMLAPTTVPKNRTSSAIKTNPKVDRNDPLLFSKWPMYLLNRLTTWNLPTPDRIVASKLGKIVYWVNTYRLCDNFALQSAVWLAKSLSIPIVVVLLVWRNELDDCMGSGSTFDGSISVPAMFEAELSKGSQNCALISFRRKSIYRLSAANAMRKRLQRLNIPMAALYLAPSSQSSAQIQAQALAAFQASIPGGIFALLTDECYEPDMNAAVRHVVQLPAFSNTVILSVDSRCIVKPSEVPLSCDESIGFSKATPSDEINAYNHITRHPEASRSVDLSMNSPGSFNEFFQSIFSEKVSQVIDSDHDFSDQLVFSSSLVTPILRELQLKVCRFKANDDIELKLLKPSTAVADNEEHVSHLAPSIDANYVLGSVVDWTPLALVLDDYQPMIEKYFIGGIFPIGSDHNGSNVNDIETNLSIPINSNGATEDTDSSCHWCEYSAMHTLNRLALFNTEVRSDASNSSRNDIDSIVPLIMTYIRFGLLSPFRVIASMCDQKKSLKMCDKEHQVDQEVTKPVGNLKGLHADIIAGLLTLDKARWLAYAQYRKSYCRQSNAIAIAPHRWESFTGDWFSLLPDAVVKIILASEPTSSSSDGTDKKLYPIHIRSANTPCDIFNDIQRSMLRSGMLPRAHLFRHWLRCLLLPGGTTDPSAASSSSPTQFGLIRELGLQLALKEVATHACHRLDDGSALISELLLEVCEVVGNSELRKSELRQC